MSKDNYYAHSLPDKPTEKWHQLYAHLIEVAKITLSFADSINADKWGYTAGLLHDLGKFSAEFQYKLISQKYEHVDHSTAGAQYINKRFPNGLGHLLAYVIAGGCWMANQTIHA